MCVLVEAVIVFFWMFVCSPGDLGAHLHLWELSSKPNVITARYLLVFFTRLIILRPIKPERTSRLSLPKFHFLSTLGGKRELECCADLLFIMANGTKLLSSCYTRYTSYTHKYTHAYRERRGCLKLDCQLVEVRRFIIPAHSLSFMALTNLPISVFFSAVILLIPCWRQHQHEKQ